MGDFIKRVGWHDKIIKSICNLIGNKENSFTTDMISIIEKYSETKMNEILKKEKEYITSIDSELLPLYENFIMEVSGMSCAEIYRVVEKRLQSKVCCFQGGFGHCVYGIKCGCHWMVRPEFYEVVKITPMENIVFMIMDKRVGVGETPCQAYWGN